MNTSTICHRCRMAMAARPKAPLSCISSKPRATISPPRSAHTAATSSTSSPSPAQAEAPNPSPSSDTDITNMLSQPTWSVRSLLPPPSPSSSSTKTTTPKITPQTLSHLLRLSALPQPASPAEEQQMLATLESQLGFVRAVRGVDTRGVAPLRATRDETGAGQRQEQAVGVAALREALEGGEDVVGHARRPRRRRPQPAARLAYMGGGGGDGGGDRRAVNGDGTSATRNNTNETEAENWDVLGGASETAGGGRYFVVRSGGGTVADSSGGSSNAKTDRGSGS